MAKILFLEDDVQVAEALATHLRVEEKHVVDTVYTCAEAEAFLQRFEYDLLILDWQIPDGSGIDLCKQLRQKGCTTPVLVLTGKTETAEKTLGLDSGADDYVVKPFSAQEIAARIRALTRRIGDPVQEQCNFADITVDPAARTVAVNHEPVKLRPREFALLEFLISEAGNTVSHKSLRDKVWWDEETVERNTINALVSRLRKKLQEAGSKVEIIAAGGEGYRLGSP